MKDEPQEEHGPRGLTVHEINQRVHFNQEPPIPIEDLWPDEAEPAADESHPV